jgi:hypothetical protein
MTEQEIDGLMLLLQAGPNVSAEVLDRVRFAAFDEVACGPPRYAGFAGLSRSPEHSAHGALY